MTRVVSNTTPIQYLFQIGKLGLLGDLYGTVVVPTAVIREIEKGRSEGVYLPEIGTFPFLQVHSPRQDGLLARLSDLGAGEVEAILLAAEVPNSIVLLDDKAARIRAKLIGLEVLGTLGVLARAKRQNLVPAVAPLVDQMRAKGFHASDALIRAILLGVGE